ncbi:hypothetical protein HG531_000601 [Fusarium graminearum]|nr:hypothetical protein HG531_000601 [Fusarium graminearum]
MASRTCPSVVSDRPASLALKLTSTALSPLSKESFLVSVALGVILAALGITLGGRSRLNAENAVAGSADAVSPLVLASSLIVSCVGNDALDTGSTTVVEGDRRELDLRGASAGEAINSRHSHCVVDLCVAK